MKLLELVIQLEKNVAGLRAEVERLYSVLGLARFENDPVSKKNCAVPGCPKLAAANVNGLCRRHHGNFRRQHKKAPWLTLSMYQKYLAERPTSNVPLEVFFRQPKTGARAVGGH